MRKYMRLRMIFAMGLMCILITGCSRTNSAYKMTDYYVQAKNEGSVDAQSVKIFITYDKPIDIKKYPTKDMKVTIAGNKISKDNYKVKKLDEDNKKIEIEIPVTSVTNGKLEISSNKNNSSMVPEISCLIPSGVTLQKVSRTIDDGANRASVEKKVSSTWNIRSIAWIRLLKDDTAVPFKEVNSAETLDGAFALHGHDFLHETEETTAKMIGEILEKYYNLDYIVTVDKKNIKVESKLQDKGGKLDLEVYLY